MAIRQKEAVYLEVVKYFGNEFKIGIKPTDEQHAAITHILAEGFVSGTIAHRHPAKVVNMEMATQYSKGLLSNWLRRDPRLAGELEQ